MFGFTPLATTPLAASQAGLSAVIVVASVVGSFSANAVTLHVSELLSSVSAVGSAGSVKANPDEVTNSVSAIATAGTVQVNLSEVLASVIATGTAEPVGYDAKGNHTLASVSGTASLEAVSAGGFEIDISERLLSVQSQGFIGGLTPHVSELLNSTTATGSITAIIPHANSLQTVVGVAAEGSVQDTALDVFEIDVSEGLLSVSATGTISPVKTSIAEPLTGVSSEASVAGVSVTAVNFPFDKNAYSANRVLYTVAQPKDIVVHINADNRTVVITDRDTTSNTIQIAA